MRRVSIDEVVEWQPCREYTRARLKKLFGRRKTLSAQNIADLGIGLDDRFWALAHMMSEKNARLCACDYASRVLRRERKAGREPDRRSWNAVKVARAFAHGKATDEERAAAGAAAGAAAWDVAGDAAREWQLKHAVKWVDK